MKSSSEPYISLLRGVIGIATRQDGGVRDLVRDLGSSAGRFVEEFNRNRDRPRLMALVSPMCPECLTGARAAHAAFKQSSDRTVVLLVWMAGLPEDDRDGAEARAVEFGEDRIHQFWDGQDLLGAHVATRLDRVGLVAWDIYLVFAPGLVWDEDMPAPAGWVHQMGDAAWAEDRERAPGHELESRIRNLLNSVETAGRA